MSILKLRSFGVRRIDVLLTWSLMVVLHVNFWLRRIGPRTLPAPGCPSCLSWQHLHPMRLHVLPCVRLGLRKVRPAFLVSPKPDLKPAPRGELQGYRKQVQLTKHQVVLSEGPSHLGGELQVKSPDSALFSHRMSLPCCPLSQGPSGALWGCGLCPLQPGSPGNSRGPEGKRCLGKSVMFPSPPILLLRPPPLFYFFID